MELTQKLVSLLLLLGCALTACSASVEEAQTEALRQAAYDPPIVITEGGTYSGRWQSLEPDVPAVRIETSEAVVIENATIRGRGHLIAGQHLDLTVRNSYGYGLHPGEADPEVSRFVHGAEVRRVVLENNYLENTSGIYFYRFTGDPGQGQTIKVLRNRARNLSGRKSFVQFNDVQNIEGAVIAWNEVVNEPGKSYVEDNINMWMSTGTPQSPIRIHDNYVQGAYLPDPLEGDYFGGGILADCGASYVTAHHNQLVNLSGHGVSIGGGHDNHMHSNRVVSTNALPDGRLFNTRANGGYVWNGSWCDAPAEGFYNNVVSDSIFAVFDPAVTWDRQRAGLWAPDCAEDEGGETRCVNNVIVYDPIDQSSEAAEWVRWQEKVADNGVVVGPEGSAYDTGAYAQ